VKLETLGMQSDSRFARKAGKDNTMVTEDHRHAGRKKSKAEKLAKMDKEMDKELYELKTDIEKVELRMRQDRRSRRMREFPMKKEKEIWPVKELMVRG
jgi:N12 class adenine-specific DNA methylase